jgi:hypothetical protein
MLPLSRFARAAVVLGALFSSRVEALESESALDEEQIARFLRAAEVIASRPIGKGSTHPIRLTLSDGTVTHDAAFQSIDDRAPVKDLEGGAELRFADSYHFNVAAFELAKLLGLDGMVPVSVERKWHRKNGSFTWWVENRWDENGWMASGVKPPDSEAWNRQIYKVRIYAQLLDDTDRNRGNILITEDWKVWMIDFTRAFRPWHELRTVSGLDRCEGALLEKLRSLDREELETKLSRQLKRSEIDALLARRDLIVAHYDELIRERGASLVLY